MTTNNNNRVPELRFPGFTGEWEEKKLGEIGTTYAGLSGKSKEDFIEGNANYITFLNVLNNVIVDNRNHPKVNVGIKESQNEVISGDLLFNTSSETPEEVGFCSVMKDNIRNLFLNSFCFGYRFNVVDEYEPLFLAYYFRSPYGRALMTKLAQGVTRYNLSKSNFLKAEIYFPTLAEQQKIADCLSSLDEEIAAEAQKADALKDHKKGLMQQLFPAMSNEQLAMSNCVPKLRFPEFEGEWVVKKLGEVFDNINNGANYNTYLTTGFPMSRIETISTGKIDFQRVGYSDVEPDQKYKMQVGDILFSHINSESRIGLIAKYNGEQTLYHGMNLLLLRANKSFDKNFVFYLMAREEMRKSIQKFAKRAINQASVSVSDLKRITAFLPPTLAEQQKIADCLSELDEMISAQQQKVEALKEHKKGLMQKLFPKIN